MSHSQGSGKNSGVGMDVVLYLALVIVVFAGVLWFAFGGLEMPSAHNAVNTQDAINNRSQ